MRKFTQGKNAGRFNQIIHDLSVEKTRRQRNAYSGNFGVVRCFLLTDTSAEPMKATGVKWDEDSADWIANGLSYDAEGAAVGVDIYPNPNFTNSDYQDDMYIFARNFGGRWISIDPAVGGGGLRKAYASAAAGAGATISCYLDTDATGELVTVNCPICGGSALNTAIPRLADGSLIMVWNDAGTWRSVMTFQATEDCE